MNNQITLGVNTQKILSGYNSPIFYQITSTNVIVYDGRKSIHLFNLAKKISLKKV